MQPHTRPETSVLMLWFVLAYLAVFAARLVLRWLNLRHLRRHGHEVPPGFEANIDADVLHRTTEYTLANARLGLVESVVGSGVILWFLAGGWLGHYERWVTDAFGTSLWAGVAFFLGLHYGHTLLDVPFRLYQTFRLEERFGFNRTTPGLWITDLLRSELVATVVLSVLSAAALGLIEWSPRHWWIWLWVFFALFSIFLMYVAPYVIEPLFFRFEPIRKEELERAIRDLMHRAGLSVSRVLQVDASRRSAHSNAYFTGIGKEKRIVLFDTLLEQMEDPEVLAILAHEVGHWKRRHLLKRLVGTELTALAALFAAHGLLGWAGLPHLVGESELALPARLVVLSVAASLVLFPVTPLSSWLSRRHEWEADAFARELTGAPRSLASALVKLAKENLSNLHPHPLYAWFYYSHPPLADRVSKLLPSRST